MSYEVLARKWRPRSFEELVGQGHVVQALVNALDNDRLHHAFLFTGTRGVGKTTIARILAKSLNCEQGVSARPCGECATCQEIDTGRFVDLIEVDAASRTKVDDTRELLDNVQYAPTRGRYKVYLIDEVHMLSGHSFNALLKTLEEPPPHVKFLLATTDPQKLPVTVLSRCLQFSLKRLTVTQMREQLEKILGAENITFDSASLDLLARAADGSMRDALSLLDQAIAFGAGKLAAKDVREMLGTIDQDSIDRILSALAGNEPATLLKVAQDCNEHGMDEEGLLNDLLLALHRIALAQADPGLLKAETEGADALQAHAKSMSAEDVQLFYQIGLHGKRDLPLAPDPHTGLEMTFLRMLAFRPADTPAQITAQSSNQHRATAKPAKRISVEAQESRPLAQQDVKPHDSVSKPAEQTMTPYSSDSDEWSNVLGKLGLSGLMLQLVSHTVLQEHKGNRISLVLDQAYSQLYSKEREAELKLALERYHGGAIKLNLSIGEPEVETPAQQCVRAQDERQRSAVEAITTDPNVRALQENFNARVNPDSIRSKV